MPVTEATHGRHRPNPQYPANVREFARRLATENEWSAYRIRRALVGRVDPLPSEHTIRNWINPDYYAEHLRRSRRYRRPGRPGETIWQLRLDRLRELREEIRLSASAAARVMNHDFGLSLSRHQVEYLLAGEAKYLRTKQKLLCPEEAA